MCKWKILLPCGDNSCETAQNKGREFTKTLKHWRSKMC